MRQARIGRGIRRVRTRISSLVAWAIGCLISMSSETRALHITRTQATIALGFCALLVDMAIVQSRRALIPLDTDEIPSGIVDVLNPDKRRHCEGLINIGSRRVGRVARLRRAYCACACRDQCDGAGTHRTEGRRQGSKAHWKAG